MEPRLWVGGKKKKKKRFGVGRDKIWVVDK